MGDDFLFPICICAILYIKVVQQLSRFDDSMLPTKELRAKRLKENNCADLMLLCVVIAFAVCTLPQRVIWIYMLSLDDIHWMSFDTYAVLAYVSHLPFCIYFIYSVLFLFSISYPYPQAWYLIYILFRFSWTWSPNKNDFFHNAVIIVYSLCKSCW